MHKSLKISTAEEILISKIQCCGSGLIVSGSTKFDESGSSPDPGQYNHQIDFKTSFKSKKNFQFSSLNLNLRD